MTALRKKDANEAMTPDPIFLPLDLQWAFGENQRPRLLPGVYRYCDLVHVDSPRPDRLIFHNAGFPSLPNELKPGEYPTIKTAGDYELDIAVAAGNARTVHRTLAIQFTGVWKNASADMAQQLRVDVLVPPLEVSWRSQLRPRAQRVLDPVRTVGSQIRRRTKAGPERLR